MAVRHIQPFLRIDMEDIWSEFLLASTLFCYVSLRTMYWICLDLVFWNHHSILPGGKKKTTSELPDSSERHPGKGHQSAHQGTHHHLGLATAPETTRFHQR